MPTCCLRLSQLPRGFMQRPQLSLHPPGFSGLSVHGAGWVWTAFGWQLPGAFPRAGEGAEVVQAADGGARGPGLEGPAETAQGSKESGASSEAAEWPPAAGWRLVPRLVLMTNVPTGLPVTCLQWTRCGENPQAILVINAPIIFVKYSQSAPELCTCNTVLLFSEVAAYQLDSTPTGSSSNFLTYYTIFYYTVLLLFFRSCGWSAWYYSYWLQQ